MRRLHRTLVWIGVAYGLGLVAYAATRPRSTPSTGLLELINNFAPWWFVGVPLVILGGIGLRSPALAAAGLVAAGAFGLTWGDVFVRPPASPPDGRPTVAVMTLNVLASNRQHGYLADTIAAESPDVVALQELEPDEAEDLVRVLGDRYPHRALRPVQKLGAGVLSRYPLRHVEDFQLSDGGNWGQRVEIDAPVGRFTLLNVHPAVPHLVRSESGGPLPIPRYDADRRNAEVRRLTRHIDAVDGPLLVTGDFNLTEYSADYHAMRARLGDAYRAAGRGLGLTFPRPWSFPHALPAPWPVVRLDYVWYSGELRPVEAHVGSSGGSDHRPVIVRFVRTETGAGEAGG
ncbi:MAG: endonuclease/exonuclease/phosphatase family protein [Chloroflexota bacterium]|nr:endonuclease/exonuclease/phosphatase family protein [Chloroflexota bacterium]